MRAASDSPPRISPALAVPFQLAFVTGFSSARQCVTRPAAPAEGSFLRARFVLACHLLVLRVHAQPTGVTTVPADASVQCTNGLSPGGGTSGDRGSADRGGVVPHGNSHPQEKGPGPLTALGLTFHENIFGGRPEEEFSSPTRAVPAGPGLGWREGAGRSRGQALVPVWPELARARGGEPPREWGPQPSPFSTSPPSCPWR